MKQNQAISYTLSHLPIILIIPALLTPAISISQTQREPTYFCLSLFPISLNFMPLSSVPFHLSLVGQFYHFNYFLTKSLIPNSSTVIQICKRNTTGLILPYTFSISYITAAGGGWGEEWISK